MISIIICSRKATYADVVAKSICETIGVPYEIIAIDNSENKYGICSAYNEGARRSKYDFLCFMHEDVKFHVNDWGQIVAGLLKDPTIGVIGVAGGVFQPKAPSGWGTTRSGSIYMNIIHSAKGEKSELHHVNSSDKKLVNVAAVDGVWLCMRKSVWQEFMFDETAFPGFHFYDVDFCTRAFPKYRICVTFDVLIEHFSKGSYDAPWYNAALAYYRMRQSYLPFGVEGLTSKEQEALSIKELIYFTCGYIDHKLDKIQSFYLVLECVKRSSFKRSSWWLVKKYLNQ